MDSSLFEEGYSIKKSPIMILRSNPHCPERQKAGVKVDLCDINFHISQ